VTIVRLLSGVPRNEVAALYTVVAIVKGIRVTIVRYHSGHCKDIRVAIVRVSQWPL
jgi:hypothetical protein